MDLTQIVLALPSTSPDVTIGKGDHQRADITARYTGIFDTIDQPTAVTNSTAPTNAIFWIGKDYMNLAHAETFRLMSDVKGELLTNLMIKRDPGTSSISLDLDALRTDPKSAFDGDNYPEFRRQVSFFDIEVASKVSGLANEKAYKYTAVCPDSVTPNEMFPTYNWIKSNWWLEAFSTIQLATYQAGIEDKSFKEDEREAMLRERFHTALDLSDPKYAAMILEYYVLKSLKPLIPYESSYTPVFDRELVKEKIALLDRFPIPKAYFDHITAFLTPFDMKVSDKSVKAILLPACLRNFDDPNNPAFDEDGNIKSLKAITGMMSFWVAIRNMFERWCEDFLNKRAAFDYKFTGLWSVMLPGLSTVAKISPAVITGRSELLTNKMVVSTDGVYADSDLDKFAEFVVDWDDGSHYRKAKRDGYEELTDFPEGYLTPPPPLLASRPESAFHTRIFKDPDTPTLYRGSMPRNVYTPFKMKVMNIRHFLAKSGGAAPDAYPKLRKITTDGSRPINDGDYYYMSGYWYAEATCYTYRPLALDVKNYVLLDASGLAVRPSTGFRRVMYLAGMTSANGENVLFDPKGHRRKISEMIANLKDREALRSMFLWPVHRWGVATRLSQDPDESRFTKLRSPVTIGND